jgi:hypothetical protein
MKSHSQRQRCSSKTPAALPTVGLVLACLGLDRPVCADGFRADLTLAGRFDERSASESDGQWVGSVTPQLGFSRHAAFAHYDAEAHRRFDSLDGDVSPRPANDVAHLSFAGATSENVDWELSGNYYRSRDPLDQDPRFTTSPGITQTSRGLAHLSLWRGEATYEAQNHDNTAPQLSDAWSQSGTASIFPLRTPQGAWVVTGRYQDWTVEDVRILSAATGMTGYRRYHSPTFSSEVQVGAVSLNDASNGFEDPRFAWSVGVNGLAAALGLPFDSRLRVGRDVATNARAEIWRDVGGLKITAGYSRTVEAEGGRFSTPQIRDYASVGMEDSRLPVVLSLEGSYGRSKPREGGADPLEIVRAAGGLSRALRPWLTGHAGYSFLRQRDIGGSEFHRSRAEVSLTASLQ